MDLDKKIKLVLENFEFSKTEEEKMRRLFLQDLGLVSVEELKDTIDELKNQGMVLSNARELIVILNSKEDIRKKAEALNDVSLAKQEPRIVNTDIFQLRKRIQKCEEYGIPYKDEEGKLLPYITDSDEWLRKQQEIENMRSNSETPVQLFETDVKSGIEQSTAANAEVDVIPDVNFDSTNLEQAKDEMTEMKNNMEGALDDALADIFNFPLNPFEEEGPKRGRAA